MAILYHPYHPTKSQPSTTAPILLLLFLILPIQTSLSLSETEALLQFKQSLQNTVALDATWTPTSPPCGVGPTFPWIGILCFQNIITGMRLESMGLTGRIDVDALSNLPALRTISITGNRFAGPIPDINRLTSLRALYLSGNQFSGQIPADYFSPMNSMKKLWLSDNNFSGAIPPSLAQLRNLIELHLENNQFNGPLPPFSQPPLVALNVSNNKLEGDAPASLSTLDKTSFSGSGLCGPISLKDCENPASPPTKVDQPSSSGPPPVAESGGGGGGGGGSNKHVMTVVTSVVFVVLMLLVLVLVMRKREDNEDDDDEVENSEVLKSSNRNESQRLVEVQVSSPLPSPVAKPNLSKKDASTTSGSGRKTGRNKKGGKGGGAGAGGMGDLVMVNEEKGKFGLADLMKASAEVLGNGGMGSAYKAVMANGVAVAVKRMREMNRLGKEAFDAEMRKLAGLKHKNLLPPLAYHYRKEEKLLVYEYIANRSLLYQLHGDGNTSNANLDWPTRLKIIHGIARGLRYLHTELSALEIPHGNLKSSNILIGKDYEPLMAEYGFSAVINTNQLQHGLFAYKAPEVVQTQKVSHKCDVYCFGLVILETLTGKFPSIYLPTNKGGVDVAQWVVSALAENREVELLDPQISEDGENVEEKAALLRVGAACVEANPDARPSMMEAIKRVEEIH